MSMSREQFIDSVRSHMIELWETEDVRLDQWVVEDVMSPLWDTFEKLQERESRMYAQKIR